MLESRDFFMSDAGDECRVVKLISGVAVPKYCKEDIGVVVC